MPTYRCWAEIRSKLYLGAFEAKSETGAIEKADYNPHWPPYSSAEDHEIVEIYAEEK